MDRDAVPSASSIGKSALMFCTEYSWKRVSKYSYDQIISSASEELIISGIKW